MGGGGRGTGGVREAGKERAAGGVLRGREAQEKCETLIFFNSTMR